MTAPAPLLAAEGLHAFYGASHVLHGVGVALAPGEAVSLLGRNGMGKTTLLRALVGLVPPRRGTVRVAGIDVTGRPADAIARLGVALVPEGRGIFPTLTVLEHLVMAARRGPGGRADWPLERVLALFPRLAERARNLGQQLSGGEQQMLSIGRALMTNPVLLLLDEPTEGLAPVIIQRIGEVLVTLKARGMTVVLVEQNFRFASKVADRFYLMDHGQMVADFPVTDLPQNMAMLNTVLGV